MTQVRALQPPHKPAENVPQKIVMDVAVGSAASLAIAATGCDSTAWNGADTADELAAAAASAAAARPLAAAHHALH